MAEATMGSARFFRRSGPHPLAVVVGVARGIANEGDLLVEGVAPLQTAGPNEVSFLDNRRYASALDQTLAGAVIVHPDMEARVPAGAVAIVTPEPYAAWARVASLFHPLPPVFPGIHPSAIVAEDVLVDPSAEVGPLSVIEAGAEIGPGLSDRCLHAYRKRRDRGAGLSHWYPCEPEPCDFGGASLRLFRRANWQEGFGFAGTRDGFLSVPQLGRAILEDDVEVGANTTIDRDLRETR